MFQDEITALFPILSKSPERYTDLFNSFFYGNSIVFILILHKKVRNFEKIASKSNKNWYTQSSLPFFYLFMKNIDAISAKTKKHIFLIDPLDTIVGHLRAPCIMKNDVSIPSTYFENTWRKLNSKLQTIFCYFVIIHFECYVFYSYSNFCLLNIWKFTNTAKFEFLVFE